MRDREKKNYDLKLFFKHFRHFQTRFHFWTKLKIFEFIQYFGPAQVTIIFDK